MKIEDDYAPLRRGTLATVRQASLSGVANRYIDLRMAPQSGREDPRRRRHRAGLDDHGRRPRPALQHVRPRDPQGAAGRDQRLGPPASRARARSSTRASPTSTRRSPPRAACSASSTATPRCSSASSSPRRSSSPTSPTAATTSPASSTTSPRRRPRSATRARRSPSRSAACPTSSAAPTPPSSTCAPRSTTSTRSSTTSKPVAKKLRPFLAELRPLARDARPTINDLSKIVRRPGDANDLIELTTAAGPAARRHHPHGSRPTARSRDGAFKASQGRAQGQHAGVRVLPALHPGPARLVRRLQPLGRLRRARRRRRASASTPTRSRSPARAAPASSSSSRRELRGQALQATLERRPEQPLPRRRRAQDRRRHRPVQAHPRLPLRRVAGAPRRVT